MKRVLFVVLIVCCLCCSGCEEQNLESRAERGFIDYVDFSDYVVADEETHILYIEYGVSDKTTLSPYYSKNGKLCRYEDGKIIEVDE